MVESKFLPYWVSDVVPVSAGKHHLRAGALTTTSRGDPVFRRTSTYKTHRKHTSFSSAVHCCSGLLKVKNTHGTWVNSPIIDPILALIPTFMLTQDRISNSALLIKFSDILLLMILVSKLGEKI